MINKIILLQLVYVHLHQTIYILRLKKVKIHLPLLRLRYKAKSAIGGKSLKLQTASGGEKIERTFAK